MKVLISVIALVAALTAGCAHVPVPGTLEATSMRIAGRSGSIALVDGSVITGESISLSRAMVSWRDPDTGRVESVPTSTVEEIRVRGSRRGAWRGFWVGCLSGGVIGAMIVANNMKCSSSEDLVDEETCRGFGAIIGSVVGGGIGGLAGSILGRSLGEDVYPLRGLLDAPPEAGDTDYTR